MLEGKIVYKGKELRFRDTARLRIHADGKLWEYERHDKKEIVFIATEFDYEGIGKWFKSWRENEGLTQAELAGKLGFSQSLISRVERDGRTAPHKLIKMIGEKLQQRRLKKLSASAEEREIEKTVQKIAKLL
jgi:ribosome-binding protein aMBF1 (putative translation factor)